LAAAAFTSLAVAAFVALLIAFRSVIALGE
jgi:hypothetical protein